MKRMIDYTALGLFGINPSGRVAGCGWPVRRLFASALWLLLLVPAAVCGDFTAAAQDSSVSGEDSPPAFDSLTSEERSDLIARLSDEQVRALLLRQLERTDGAAEDETEGSAAAAALGSVDRSAEHIRDNLWATLAQFDELPDVIPFAVSRLTEGRPSTHLLLVLFGFMLMLAAGAGAEALFRRATTGLRERLERTQAAQTDPELGLLALRFLLELAAIGLFGLVAAAVFFGLHHGHDPTRLTVLAFLSIVPLVRIASLVSRFILAPRMPALRLVPLDDSTAPRLHRDSVIVAGLAFGGVLTCALLRLLGLQDDLVDLLLMLIGTIITAAAVATIWRSRHGVAAAIRGRSDPAETHPVRRAAADSWHALAIVYVIGVFLLSVFTRLAGWPLPLGAGVGSVLLLLVLPIADSLAGRTLRAAFRGQEIAGRADLPSTGERVFRRATRIALLLFAVFMLGQLWGLDIVFVARKTVGTVVTRAILDIGLVALVAYLVWELAKAAIDRRIAVHAPAPGRANEAHDAEGDGIGATRLRTLLVLLRRFLFVAIASIAIMIVLSSLGVDIGPLLAGAGVLGLAIGFGAQTLVKDIVSGVFFLIDDAFRLGEYIDVGGAKGTVERINVRSLVLRHHRGPLNTVPFGEIAQVQNFSRDWAIIKLEFRVTYDTDVTKVKKIFKQIGQELLADPHLGPAFLEPFKSQGVYAMEDSAMIVRGKFTAKPGRQFEIRKEVYRRVQEAFLENAIEFAHRRVSVELPEGIDPQGPQAERLRNAAAATLAGDEAGTGEPPSSASG